MRTSIYAILGIIGIILVVVMMMALTSVSGVGPADDEAMTSEELAAFIPLESSVWQYSDGETYKKVMVTEEVYESDQFKNIIVKGEEDDESIKSYRSDYAFEYIYKVEENQLTRSLEGKVILDGFDHVTLLKLPLKENSNWQDTWTGMNGETYSVTSTITSIDENAKTVVVESKERSGAFVIERALEQGKGVTAFKITEKYDDIEFETGYQLLTIEPFEYKGYDRYTALLGNEKIGTDIDTIEETSLESSVETEVSSENDSLDTSEETEDINNEESVIQENEEIDEDVRLAIESSIKTFNDKWIAYINDGDMSIMETITPNASVEKIIEAYMDKEMTQQFLAMEIERVVVRGNVANAYVYEEIERTMDGMTEVLIYNWIYEIDNIDGIWLVEGYIENKNP